MKNLSVKLSSFIFIILIAFAACNETTDRREGDAAAQGDNMIGDADKRSVNAEGKFITDAIEDNAEEIALLRMGVNNGTDPELKSHAQTMLNDHEKLHYTLLNYARTNNVDLSDVDTVRNININENRGVEWDEEWADEVSDLHDRMIRRFERAEGRIQDATLKNELSTSLPLMKKHVQVTDSLEKRLDRNK